MRTRVYVDAFNLYYGALRGTRYRWLNLACLCKTLLPRHDIDHIRYFTALVASRPDDPGQSVRQQIYLRALRTLPNLDIHFGFFLTHVVTMRRWVPGRAGEAVAVVKTEEKGSDVNLATYLLTDGFQDKYDAAVLITNDSDLVEPIRIVRTELGKVVGLINPQPRPSRALMRHATFVKQIRSGVLAASQFPEVLVDRTGKFSKPRVW